MRSFQSFAVRISKVRRYTSRRLTHLPLFLRDQRYSTYRTNYPRGTLAHYFSTLPRDLLEKDRTRILELADLFTAHRFDLLGSGWVQVRHGMICRGLEGIVYPATEAIRTDPDGHWLNGYINPPNLPESRRIWRLIDADYQPIDWQLDFKSGWRWSEQTWHLAIRYAHHPCVDIKVPWELARMQHLATLAFAYMLTSNVRYAREFRNQVLDFIATNPPRFGVNWYSAMDVGIRAANWLTTHDLFRAAGMMFDEAFEDVFRRSLYEHGLYLRNDPEWRSDWRGNHYLSAVAGLLFIAAYLPLDDQIKAWRTFAIRELLHETTLQFNADGSNFEASTCYHRLSAEIVTYATALILRLDAALVPADHLARLAKMAAFTLTITKPDGHVPQFGDNDNGRFLKLNVAYRRRTVGEAKSLYANLDGYDELPDDAVYWDEDHLDHWHLVAAINGLVPQQNFAAFTPGYELETALISDLSSVSRLTLKRQAERTKSTEVDSIAASPLQWTLLPEPGNKFPGVSFPCPEGDLLEDLQRTAFPDFGLYVYRSRRLYLAIRCGAIGQRGNGGHAHNDQLAIELTLNDVNLIVDPGTYLYSPLPARRNEYRSVRAHFAPRLDQSEPGRLDLGLFTLGDTAHAECVVFGEREFIGRHHGYGTPVYRRIQIDSSQILIEDSLPAAQFVSLPVSPGYGIRYRAQSVEQS